VKPDATQYDPRPEYLAELIGSTGLTQAALAAKIGVDERTIRRWLSGERQFNYRDQFAIECLVLSV
jgi:transcriptional regulator with XRE-family HTH domain